MKSAAPSEAQIQQAIIKYLKIALPDHALIHATLAEGVRGGRQGMIDGARRKAMGQMAGMPDILIFAYGRGFCLEVKTKTGRLSPAQKHVHEILQRQGIPCAVVRSVDDADAFAASMGLLRSQEAKWGQADGLHTAEACPPEPSHNI
jgi:hypothetical protein